jgi:hypothetical protein
MMAQGQHNLQSGDTPTGNQDLWLRVKGSLDRHTSILGRGGAIHIGLYHAGGCG